ncbi:MAG: hypothetical protein CMK06_09900 [Ponticaulis sp.]|nr:hypothetical protein [Ponticaulis sp.]
MKRVWTAIMIALSAPYAMAGETGQKVPQVIAEPAAPMIGPITVQFQESVPITLRESVAGVSVGSSYVANVAVHDSHTILITGRSYGTTSLHVIDGDGNVVVDTVIQVVDMSPSRVTVNRGGSDYSMHCAPNCRPAPNVGDEKEYFSDTVQQAQSISR